MGLYSLKMLVKINTRINLFLSIVLLSFACKSNLFSQTLRLDTLCTVNPLNNETYIFPVVFTKDPTISKPINSYLQDDFLDNEDYNNPNIFKNIWANSENELPTLSEIKIESYQLTEQCFSIEISALACGAYCEKFSSIYNFDLSNGRLVELSEIFSEEGMESLEVQLNNLKTDVIKEHMSTLSQYKSNIKSASEGLFYEDALAVYANCKPEVNLNYVQFFITKNTIRFELERCSNHVLRALDELGAFDFYFKFSEIENYLSIHGKQLLIN